MITINMSNLLRVVLPYIYPLAELKCSYNDIQKVAHIVDF